MLSDFRSQSLSVRAISEAKEKVSHLEIHFWIAVVMGKGCPASLEQLSLPTITVTSCKLPLLFFCTMIAATFSDRYKDAFLLREAHQWG